MSEQDDITFCAAKIADLAAHLERLDSGSGDAAALRMCAKYLQQQQADIAALQAEADALREALEPFADAKYMGAGAFSRADLSDDDFRRARAALSRSPSGAVG